MARQVIAMIIAATMKKACFFAFIKSPFLCGLFSADSDTSKEFPLRSWFYVAMAGGAWLPRGIMRMR